MSRARLHAVLPQVQTVGLASLAVSILGTMVEIERELADYRGARSTASAFTMECGRLGLDHVEHVFDISLFRLALSEDSGTGTLSDFERLAASPQVREDAWSFSMMLTGLANAMRHAGRLDDAFITFGQAAGVGRSIGAPSLWLAAEAGLCLVSGLTGDPSDGATRLIDVERQSAALELAFISNQCLFFRAALAPPWRRRSLGPHLSQGMPARPARVGSHRLPVPGVRPVAGAGPGGAQRPRACGAPSPARPGACPQREICAPVHRRVQRRRRLAAGAGRSRRADSTPIQTSHKSLWHGQGSTARRGSYARCASYCRAASRTSGGLATLPAASTRCSASSQRVFATTRSRRGCTSQKRRSKRTSTTSSPSWASPTASKPCCTIGRSSHRAPPKIQPRADFTLTRGR